MDPQYRPSKVRDRAVPSDKQIAEQWAKIPNPAWRWVYGMMAAFRLRKHEVFLPSALALSHSKVRRKW